MELYSRVTWQSPTYCELPQCLKSKLAPNQKCSEMRRTRVISTWTRTTLAVDYFEATQHGRLSTFLCMSPSGERKSRSQVTVHAFCQYTECVWCVQTGQCSALTTLRKSVCVYVHAHMACLACKNTRDYERGRTFSFL